MNAFRILILGIASKFPKQKSRFFNSVRTGIKHPRFNRSRTSALGVENSEKGQEYICSVRDKERNS